MKRREKFAEFHTNLCAQRTRANGCRGVVNVMGTTGKAKANLVGVILTKSDRSGKRVEEDITQ